MSLVLDSSAALARVYLDECTTLIDEVFERIIEGGAWVPGLWKLEIANILETGARRGRHDVAFSDASLADLSLLPIQVDGETEGQAWGGYSSIGKETSTHFLRCGLSGACDSAQTTACFIG